MQNISQNSHAMLLEFINSFHGTDLTYVALLGIIFFMNNNKSIKVIQIIQAWWLILSRSKFVGKKKKKDISKIQEYLTVEQSFN